MQPFDLSAGQRFDLDYNAEVLSFVAAEHPGAKGQAHAFTGSEGTVFHLHAIGGGEAAMKVYKHRFRTPDMPLIAQRLHPLRNLPGLRVCERHCIDPSSSQMILSAYPDLRYAQIFPWVSGVTWSDIVRLKRPLSPSLCIQIAGGLVDVLVALEAKGIAHCDLSGPNVIIDVRANRVELVDVEHLHVPGFPTPSTLVAGTPGYNLISNFEDVWSPISDRYAGAIMLAEMLCFHDPSVIAAACGAGCYFDAAEMGAPDSTRYQVLREVLARLAPTLVRLLDQVWTARRRAQCPSIAEWAAALAPVRARMASSSAAPVPPVHAQVAPTRSAPVLGGTVLLSRVPISPIAASLGNAVPTAALSSIGALPTQPLAPPGMSPAAGPQWTWAPLTDDTDDLPDPSLAVTWEQLTD